MTIPATAETISRLVMVPVEVTFDATHPASVALAGMEPGQADAAMATSAVQQIARLFAMHNAHAEHARLAIHVHDECSTVAVIRPGIPGIVDPDAEA